MHIWLGPDSNWALDIVLLLAPGTLTSIILLAIPKRRLAHWGGARYGSPNWLTVLTIPLFFGGLAVFFKVSVPLGFWLVVVACILDILDGRKSVGMAELGIARSALDCWLGAWFDPFADKLRNLLGMALFVQLGAISPWIFWATFVPEMVGTVLREPFSTAYAACRSDVLGGFLVRFMYEVERSCGVKSRANPIGKVKTTVQCFGFIMCALWWLDIGRGLHLPDWFFGAAVPLCVLSPFTRYLTYQPVKEFLVRAGQYFKHQDVF